ncbi:hypothetical protein AVEN_11296-1 [Araneus ventricosus]|uniref:Uncharacterized protein n=1 Tax=Araneus ventricosus TaxID=182803 RepID=A0A4Y2E1Z9_ARAVE|nr:hypothetical protein AVEN_11296-1 [Araneus ventricosus]
MEVAFNSSHEKHDWNTKQQLVRNRNPKKENINSHSFFTSLSQLAERKKEGTCVPPCCHSCSSSQRPVLKQVHLEHSSVHFRSNYNTVLFTFLPPKKNRAPSKTSK